MALAARAFSYSLSRLCCSQLATDSEYDSHTVTMLRSPGEKVGLVLLAASASAWIIVDIVPNTLSSRWNEENPSTPIVRGQAILSVNGISDKLEIQRRFAEDDQFEIVLRTRLDQQHIMLVSRHEKIKARSQQFHSLPSITAGECYEPFCSICMEDLDPSEVVAELGCRHAFHHKCLLPWFMARPGSSFCCPLCKVEVSTKGQSI
eukprot:TRINITY_DN3584_c0_g2_i1.p1 TRINITY_DN3584_c0_g2~~TRINITY_DN3584_c0_g2_i1.p1  ORF type:complete len:205 (+),score=22.58 TRINITY_DN3584_c0_g2_i1:84-698(+)